MGLKDEIAGSYTKSMIERHGQKSINPGPRRILVFGTNGDQDNIGASIVRRLFQSHHVQGIQEGDFDICRPLTYPDMTEVDAIVNCCGFTNLDWIENQPLTAIREAVEVNLIGPMTLTAEFVRQTIENRYLKHVIHIGSMAYNHVLNASAPYCASKAGLAHFVECAAYEMTPKGYRVHCVHPSNTEGTPMTRETIEGIMKYRDVSYDEAVEYWAASNQMPRWLQPEDIADAVTWLLSDKADFWSGQQVELKGGNR